MIKNSKKLYVIMILVLIILIISFCVILLPNSYEYFIGRHLHYLQTIQIGATKEEILYNAGQPFQVIPYDAIKDNLPETNRKLEFKPVGDVFVYNNLDRIIYVFFDKEGHVVRVFWDKT